MLARFAVLGGAIVVGVLVLLPDRAFGLPRENRSLWLQIMIGYPILSVYPQEVIFRAFFFRRYQPLFGRGWGMVAASAVMFAFVHIVFGNPIAIPMTLIGGVMFASTYSRSRSLLAASVEHALYGCLVFTVGLGSYFYSGALNG
ncbi:MAG: CPBP family intramembrane metalloprotease [Phycisphaerales bacterium]|nr:CPBP family intramembrane metalloprotease [Phycisphaerales bacterium]